MKKDLFEPLQMPKALQVHNLKEAVKKQGLDPNDYDFESLDSNLSFPENKKIFEETYKLDLRGEEKYSKSNIETIQLKFDSYSTEEYIKEIESQEKKEKNDAYNSIFALLEYCDKHGTFSEKLSPERVTVYEIRSAKKLLKILQARLAKHAKNKSLNVKVGSRETHYLLANHGYNQFVRDLKKFDLIEILNIIGWIDVCFTTPRRKYGINFNIIKNILRGAIRAGSDENEIMLFIDKGQKEKLDDLKGHLGISKNLICYMYIIYTMNQTLKDDLESQSYTNSRYYIRDDELIKDIRDHLKIIHEEAILYFKNILDVLEKESRLNIMNENYNNMIKTIRMIKKMLLKYDKNYATNATTEPTDNSGSSDLIDDGKDTGIEHTGEEGTGIEPANIENTGIETITEYEPIENAENIENELNEDSAENTGNETHEDPENLGNEPIDDERNSGNELNEGGKNTGNEPNGDAGNSCGWNNPKKTIPPINILDF